MINILTHNLSPKTTIPKAIVAERSERLTGENTLRFSTLLKEVTANLIAVGDVASVDGEYYDIVSVTKEQASDGLRKIAVECEHVSYRLNDIDVEFFTQIGTPQVIMSEILSGTGFSLAACEFSATETFSLQEKSSKRGLVQSYAAYIGAEVEYSRFSVSLVRHRGSASAVQLKSGRDILLLRETITTDGVAYDCSVLKPQAFNLGDNVTVDYPSMGITANLRVNGITRNPYDNRQVSVEIANAPNLLEGDFCRIKTDMVTKGNKYFGIRISAENGFEVERNDGLSKATFNSDVFEMSSLVDGVMTPAIYFDAVERRYKIAGIVDVDGSIITNAITAQIAEIANLVADKIDVSQLVSDDIQAQMATIVQLVAQEINVEQLVADEIAANTATIVQAVISQLSADEGDIVDLTVDKLNTNYGGGKTDYIYIHDEEIEFKSGDYVKAQFAFANIGGNKLPALILGAGDGTASGSRGLVYKHNTGLRVGYIAGGSSGENFADFGENGIILQSGGGTYLLNLSGGENNQVLTKHGNSIVWAKVGAGGTIDVGNANFVVLDHVPTQEEVDGFEVNTLIFVYDLNDATARWGQSAYDVAKQQGYGGDSDAYNDALGQVGNMSDVLDAILNYG